MAELVQANVLEYPADVTLTSALLRPVALYDFATLSVTSIVSAVVFESPSEPLQSYVYV